MTRNRQIMDELVEWLAGIEHLAHDVYADIAAVLGKNTELSRFVTQLAENEQQHAEMMSEVKALLRGLKSAPRSDIRLDDATREHVELPLRMLQAETANGSITEVRAINLIAEVEFSEWNDIFLYVVNTIRMQSRETELMSATIQEHERSIEAFNARLPAALRPHLDVSRLTKIWDTRLLLVDDHRIIRDALAGFLGALGQVTAVASAEKALDATGRHFFDAIVSDIIMPGMSGIKLHEEAVTQHPDLNGRFLFMSFRPTEGQARYIQAHGLPFLLKPFGPDELTTEVQKILSGVSVPENHKETTDGDA